MGQISSSDSVPTSGIPETLSTPEGAGGSPLFGSRLFQTAAAAPWPVSGLRPSCPPVRSMGLFPLSLLKSPTLAASMELAPGAGSCPCTSSNYAAAPDWEPAPSAAPPRCQTGLEGTHLILQLCPALRQGCRANERMRGSQPVMRQSQMFTDGHCYCWKDCKAEFVFQLPSRVVRIK